jgi:hypothetical protein
MGPLASNISLSVFRSPRSRAWEGATHHGLIGFRLLRCRLLSLGRQRSKQHARKN